MSPFLLPSTPLYGHVAPMLTVGRGLVERGHRVTVLTGSKYRAEAEAAGLAFRPLPAEVDYDDANLADWLPDRERYRGIAAGRYDVIGMFVRPLRTQYAALADALAAGPADGEPYDAVLAEAAYLGVLPLLLGASTAGRLPVAAVSATPLALRSVDCGPFGSGIQPVDILRTTHRNRALNALLARGPLRPIQEALDDALEPYGVPAGLVNYFDAVTWFDRTFQLSAAGIEYPRREMPDSVWFVGPLRPPPPAGTRLPDWWPELAGDRPVVHVTQGTMANADPGQLIVPTITGLAGEDVLVVATTGGRPVAEVTDRLGGRLPANARVAEFLPYDDLLPRTTVMVTNGGFGGVQRALAYGVPLVVAGRTEDKPEVAGRVTWSGTGRNLWTGHPSPGRVRRAVRAVATDRSYAAAAARLAREIADLGDPVTTIAEGLEGLVEPTLVRPGLGPPGLGQGGLTLRGRPGPRTRDAARSSRG